MSKTTMTKFLKDTLAAVQKEDPAWEMTDLSRNAMEVTHPTAGSFKIYGDPKNPGAAKQRAIQRARSRVRLADSNVGRVLGQLRADLGIGDDECRDVRVNLNAYVREWVERQPDGANMSIKSLTNMLNAELQIVERRRGVGGSVWRIAGPDYDPDAPANGKNGKVKQTPEFDLPGIDDTMILKLMEEHPLLIDGRVNAHYHAKHGGADGLVEEVEKLRDLTGMTEFRVAQYLAVEPERVKAAYEILSMRDREAEKEQALALAAAAVGAAGLDPDEGEGKALVQSAVEPEIDVPVIDKRTGEELPMPEPGAEDFDPEPEPTWQSKLPEPEPETVGGITLPPEVAALLRQSLVGDLEARLKAAEDRANEAEQRLAYAVEQMNAWAERIGAARLTLVEISDDVAETIALVTV